MVESDEFKVYTAGQIATDTVRDTAKQLAGSSSTQDTSISEIEQRTGRQVNAGHRALMRAGRVVGSQVAPALSAVMEDVAQNGSTRENTQAIPPAIITDAALAVPRLRALAKNPAEFEAMTAAEMGAVQLGRHAYDKLVLGNREVRTYSVPTEGMKRVQTRLGSLKKEITDRFNR